MSRVSASAVTVSSRSVASHLTRTPLSPSLPSALHLLHQRQQKQKQRLTRTFSTTVKNMRPLTADRLNPAIRNVEYAVRGELAIKAESYRNQLKQSDHGLPFDRVISSNIGNPQQKGLDQRPITFTRQVSVAHGPRFFPGFYFRITIHCHAVSKVSFQMACFVRVLLTECVLLCTVTLVIITCSFRAYP